MVVKQDRGVVHGREADRWDSHLTSEHVQQWKEKGKCWKENLFYQYRAIWRSIPGFQKQRLLLVEQSRFEREIICLCWNFNSSIFHFHLYCICICICIRICVSIVLYCILFEDHQGTQVCLTVGNVPQLLETTPALVATLPRKKLVVNNNGNILLCGWTTLP